MFRKLFTAVALCALALSAQAVEYTSKVEHAACTLVAKTDSTVGTVGGAAVGAGAGAVVGGLLFGKKGKGWGAAAGGLAGGYAGNEMAATKTYSCVVKYKNDKDKDAYAETLGKERRVGEQLMIFQGEDGKVLVR